jgi:hypothetical protein
MKLLDFDGKLALLGRLAGRARSLGPYLAIELLLPGGSVVALLLWLLLAHSPIKSRWISCISTISTALKHSS